MANVAQHRKLAGEGEESQQILMNPAIAKASHNSAV